MAKCSECGFLTIRVLQFYNEKMYKEIDDINSTIIDQQRQKIKEQESKIEDTKRALPLIFNRFDCMGQVTKEVIVGFGGDLDAIAMKGEERCPVSEEEAEFLFEFLQGVQYKW